MKKLLPIILLFFCYTAFAASPSLDVSGIGHVIRPIQASDGTYLYAPDLTLIKKYDSDWAYTAGHNFGAGHTAKRIWTTSTPGRIFILEVDSDSKYHLWRSTDSGATATSVLDIGDDGEGTQIASVLILDRGFVEVSANTYFVGEYGDGEYCRIMKSVDGGANWTEEVHFNSAGESDNIRHIHALIYAHGYLYVCTGDNDSTGQVGIIRWDLSTAWVDDQDPDYYADKAGFEVLHGAQRYRTVDLLPTDDSLVWISDCDTGDAAERGIWIAPVDLSEATRVNSDITAYADHIGWTGLKSSTGRYYLTDYVKTGATDYQINIWSSYTGIAEWQVIGKFGTTGTTETLNISEGFGKIYLNGNNGRGSGKDSSKSTAIVAEGDLYNEEWPLVLHPVYYVATTGTDGVDLVEAASNYQGWTSAAPWATLEYALEGDKITKGARVIVAAGVYEQNETIPDWDANAVPGTGITFIEGAGQTDTIINKAAAAGNAYVLYHSAEEGECVYSNMQIYTAKSSAADNVIYAGTSGSPTVIRSRDMKWGKIDQVLHAGSRIVRVFGTFEAKRSQFELEGVVNVADIILSGADNAVIALENCVLYGGYYGVHAAHAGVTLSLIKNTFNEFDSVAVYFSDAYNGDPVIKNNFFQSTIATLDMKDDATLTETLVDYNYTTHAALGATVVQGEHSAVGVVPYLDALFRPLAKSPLIGKGQNAITIGAKGAVRGSVLAGF